MSVEKLRSYIETLVNMIPGGWDIGDILNYNKNELVTLAFGFQNLINTLAIVAFNKEKNNE